MPPARLERSGIAGRRQCLNEGAKIPDRPRRWVVVTMPPFGVSTKEAYRWFDESRAPTLKGSRSRRNDLQAVVVAHHPEIGQLIDELRHRGASAAAMSGSGSAVFGLFPRLPVAEAAAAAVVGHGRRVLITRTLSRRDHQRLSRPVLARK